MCPACRLRDELSDIGAQLHRRARDQRLDAALHAASSGPAIPERESEVEAFLRRRNELRDAGLGLAAGIVLALLVMVALAGIVVGAVLLVGGHLLAGVLVVAGALFAGWAT